MNSSANGINSSDSDSEDLDKTDTSDTGLACPSVNGALHVDGTRLAMYTAEYGGYCSGGDRDALKQLIQDGVSYAEKRRGGNYRTLKK